MLFEEATRQKLRFQTDRGVLSVEDLWDMSLTNLNTLAKSLRRKLKAEEEEDFLETKTEKETIDKLRFDVVLFVLETKKSEKKESELAADKKAKRQVLMNLLAEKEAEDMKKLNKEELLAKISELS